MGIPPHYVAYEDFVAKARKVLPPPAFTYLQSGIGHEEGLRRNAADLDKVLLTPVPNGSAEAADPAVMLFGRRWAYPFGIAPVGMPGFLCPGAEAALAEASRGIGAPYTLSTVASASIEDIAAVAGPSFWFQLYPAKSDEIRADLIARAAKAGAETMMVTVDIPIGQRREPTMRAGVDVPVRLGPLMRAAPFHPRWALRMARGPRPNLTNLLPYFGQPKDISFLRAVNEQISQPTGVGLVSEIRKAWRGTLIVKGLLDASSAAAMMEAGADAVLVSNHGGRQLDAAPSTARALPKIREALGPGATILVDGGIASGLDILRMLRLGADMALLGKYPYTAVGALGVKAAKPALAILAHQIESVMVQLGVRTIGDLKTLALDFA